MSTQQNTDPIVPASVTGSVLNEENSIYLMEPMLNQIEEISNPVPTDVISSNPVGEVEFDPVFDEHHKYSSKYPYCSVHFEDEIVTPENIDEILSQTKASEAVKQTIKWLVERNYPTIPVAPSQDSVKYPKKSKNKETGWQIEYQEDGVTPKSSFTGKNPSFLTESGYPALVKHKVYQDRKKPQSSEPFIGGYQPTRSDILRWWGNPTNGVGTLGGWNNTIWVDPDSKSFGSQEECDRVISEWVDLYPPLNNFLERSPNGGYHCGVRVKNFPDFVDFKFGKDGQKVGEALGIGRFVVLSPTQFIGGKFADEYVSLSREELPVFESLESINIYQTKKAQPKKTRTDSTTNSTHKAPKKAQSTNGETGEVLLKLEELISPNNKKILEGDHSGEKDRSKSITALASELLGWCNWCDKNDVPCETDYETLVNNACNECGIDEARAARILESMGETSLLMPASHQHGDIACWKKVYKVNKDIFETFCPNPTQIDTKKSMKNDVYKLQGLTDKEIEAKIAEEFPEDNDYDFEDCLNLPSDEEIEEKEEQRKSRLKIYEETYASLNELPIRDDFSFFHPAYAKQLKVFVKNSQSSGSSFGHALAGVTLMAGVSPITNVIDGIGIIDRPSYPYCVNAGDTTAGKSDVIPRPQYIAKKFLSIINQEMSKTSYEFLIKECTNDDKLKQKILGLNSIASFKKIEDLSLIKPIMLDSDESTTQGTRTFYGFFEFGKKIRTIRDDLYIGFYRHPLLLLKDEGGGLLKNIYLNQSVYFASRGELNECKEYLDPVSGDKMLASENKLQQAINVPRTYIFNSTIKDLNFCFNNDKSSSDGLTGRHLFNFMHTPEFEYPDEAETDNSKDWLKFFNLGAVIIAFAMSQKICHSSGDEINEFVFSKEARTVYKAFDEERKRIRSNMLDTFPEWSSLIDNYFAKVWQGVVDVAPNLKRFNDCLSQFFNLLKIIYPKIQQEKFLSIVSKNCKSSDLIKFAKVLYSSSRLPKGYEFTEASSYTFEDLLDPIVREVRTGKTLPLSLAIIFLETEIESLARGSAIVPVSSLLNETDITHATNIVLNSCHSFGMILHSFNIKGYTASQETKAAQARATDTLLKSSDKYGTEYRVSIIVDYLSKTKIGDTLTLSKLKKSKGDAIEKNERHFESILEKLAELGIFEEGVKNTRNQFSYEIKRIPKKTEIPKITKACDS